MSFDKSTPSKSKKVDRKGDSLGIFVENIFQEYIVVSSLGLWHLIKSFYTPKAILTLPLTCGLAYGCFWASQRGWHLTYLYKQDPSIFTPARMDWLWKKIPKIYHMGFLLWLGFTPMVLFLGILAQSIRTKFKKIFTKIGMTNNFGDTPKLIKEVKIDGHRTQYHFDCNGLTINDFEAHTDQLEGFFKSNIETIKYGKHKGIVVLTFSKEKFPEKVSYLDLTLQKNLPHECFYLGMTVEGIKTQRITDLPHMLIAGTTGSGKSVFFKQMLLGLLESTPHLQMYLVDLKGGLEMIDFAKAPNVRIIKDVNEAVNTLKTVERKMKERFAYLEANNKKQIIPEVDKQERIVVAIDEASVLYMSRNKFDPDYHASIEARTLADSISKLSRAAAIHLLLATQKLDRQVIPTSVSENISGRMCFRANSLQGSLIVLGTKDAMDLPEIPGRGIWSFGTQKLIVQSPFIDEKSIKKRCEHIAELFKNGKRELLSPMLGTEAKIEMKNDKKKIYQQQQGDLE